MFLKKDVEKELAKYVTFKGNYGLPVYNWFPYREGFSKQLVDFLIDKYSLKGRLYDPFCGTGTSLLVAKERGIPSIGIDISPLMVLVSKAKTRNYNVETLKETLKKLEKKKYYFLGEIPKEKWIRKALIAANIRKLIAIKEEIKNLEEKERDFFTLALIRAMNLVAKVKKQGACLKRVKKPNIPLDKAFFRYARKMIRDLETSSFSSLEPEVYKADARNFKTKADFVITSPPYLNKVEYTRAYGLELFFFFEETPTVLNSYIGDNGEDVVEKYFDDLEKVLENLKGIKDIIFVIAGGCVGKKLINSDEIFIDLAEEKDYILKEKIIARKIVCHDENRKKTGVVNESIVYLQRV